MGKSLSKCCQCFTSSQEPASTSMQSLHWPLVQETLSQQFPSPASQMFDQNYLQGLLARAVQLFMQNAKQTEDLQIISSTSDLQISTKEIGRGYFVRSIWSVPFSPEQFVDFMLKSDRKSWDTNIDSILTLARPTPDITVTYTTYKGMLIVSARDLLLVTKLVRLDKGLLIISTSCDHQEFEPSSRYVRATVDAGGYLVEEQESDGGSISKITSVSIGNFGGNMGTKIVRQISTSNAPKFVKTLKSALERYHKTQN